MPYYLLSGLTLGFSAALTPGPFQAFLLSQSAKFGWRGTLPAAFAPLASDGPIIILMVLILSRAPDWFLRTLMIAGGVFLVYLAYEAYKAYSSFEETVPPESIQPQPISSRFFKAVLINAMGPGPYVFWSLIAGPILVEGWLSKPTLGASFLLGFYGSLIGANIFLITVFATARRLGNRLNRAMIGIAALALFVFGLAQLTRGIRELAV